MPYRILVLLTAAFFVVACSSETPADLIILDANVVDVETGEINENQAIEIRDGKISAIHSGEAGIEAGDTLLASGKFVIPGLWDMHVHFSGEDLIAENKNLLSLYIANGVTTVKDAGGDITPAILQWEEEIENGQTVGPNIFTSGPKVDGPGPNPINLTSAEQVPAAFDSLESLGVDYVKLYDISIAAEVYLAAIEEAKKRGLLVTGHVPSTVDFNDAVAAGLDATEHMHFVLKGSSSEEDTITEAVREGKYNYGREPVMTKVIETYDEETATETYRQMADAGTGVVSTLYLGKVMEFLNEEDHSDDEYLQYVGEDIQEAYQFKLWYERTLSEALPQFRRNLRDRFMSMIPDIHEAGVPILAGTDTSPSSPFVYPGISLHKELEELVAAGLTPLEALQTSVINAPEFFGVSDSYGKVKQGYAADLLLLNSNPLDNISNTQDIHAVILGGDSIFANEELQELLTSHPSQ